MFVRYKIEFYIYQLLLLQLSLFSDRPTPGPFLPCEDLFGKKCRLNCFDYHIYTMCFFRLVEPTMWSLGCLPYVFVGQF